MGVDTKTKIFIFFIFVVVAIVLVTEVFNFINNGFFTINNKKNEINCNKVEISNLNYINNFLLFDVSSQRMNISEITLIIDDTNETKFNIETIHPGETKTITLQNITITKKYKIYAQDCMETAVENEI